MIKRSNLENAPYSYVLRFAKWITKNRIGALTEQSDLIDVILDEIRWQREQDGVYGDWKAEHETEYKDTDEVY